MKLIFAGTPEFAVPTLQRLIDSQHEVVAVYTQPDRPAGRGQQMRASPVKQLAESNGILVVQPLSLRDESAINELRRFQPGLMIVVAYGLILPAEVLAIPLHGCLNVHASLLPRWRGAAPIQRAILAGDTKTGVTIMQMDEGLDTGDTLKFSEVTISDDMTAEGLHDELAILGGDALLEVVDSIEAGNCPPAVQQDEQQANYAAKLSKAEAEIDWTLPAPQVLRLIKAFNPWPVAFTSWSGKSLRIWDARIAEDSSAGNPGKLVSIDHKLPVIACGDGALVLLEVQPEGKKRMPANAYMNARQADIKTGMVFG
ncbi:MAG: methionyl-tRNA formyltransferase [Gammaproteobacteria bacterium]|nr:methionyl-tRNA formyltransferase [Gammaproteobacteria bacterium]